jgi:hypothetical protein
LNKEPWDNSGKVESMNNEPFDRLREQVQGKK